MSSRTPTTCDHCEQTDTDPKVHGVDGSTKHHDCLSASEERRLRESSDVTAEVIDACKAGAKGADLLKVIRSKSKDS